MMLRTLKPEAGFTLIETMIAVVIFAAVSAAGVAVLSGYASGTRAIASSDEFSSDLSKFHSLLSDDMAHFVPRPVRNSDGNVEAPFAVISKDRNSLFHIVRLASVLAPESDERVEGASLVEYRFVDNTLVRRTFDHPDRLQETKYVDEVVMQGVEKAEVRYQKNSVWLTKWLPLSTAPDTPDLVEVTLSFAGKGKITSIYKLKGRSV